MKESQPFVLGKSSLRKSFEEFYLALGKLLDRDIDCKSLKKLSANQGGFVEAIDGNCCILICETKSDTNKPHALKVLHSQEFKNNGKYDLELCGTMQKPSPVWIHSNAKYQVVTVFGSNMGKRRKYVEQLLTDRNTVQIFPIN